MFILQGMKMQKFLVVGLGRVQVGVGHKKKVQYQGASFARKLMNMYGGTCITHPRLYTSNLRRLFGVEICHTYSP